MRRIDSELELLRRHYPRVDHLDQTALHWFMVHDYVMPDPCSPRKSRVVFCVNNAPSDANPYGFFILDELRHDGRPFATKSPPHPPPFDGCWLFLSWAPACGWFPGQDVKSGDNLWTWTRSFADRLVEGP